MLSGLTTYVYTGVAHCGVVQSDLLHVLFVLCGVYAVVFVTCASIAVLGLLTYRAERRRKHSAEVYHSTFS